MRGFSGTLVLLLGLIGAPPVRADVLLMGTINDAFSSQVGGIQLRIGQPIDLRNAVIIVHANDVSRLAASSAINFGPGCSSCIALLSAAPNDPLTPRLHQVLNNRESDLPKGEIRIFLRYKPFSEVLAGFHVNTGSGPSPRGAQPPPGSPPPSSRDGDGAHTLVTEDGKCELEHICTDPQKDKICASTKCGDLEFEICNSEMQLNRSVSVGPIDITIHGIPPSSDDP